MRKILAIALNGLLRMGRDRKALIMFLLMPLILIGILGVSLKEMMSLGQINPFDVVVVNEDRPAKPSLPPGAPEAARAQLPTIYLGQILVDEVLGSDGIKKMIRLTQTEDLAAAKQLVADGKAVAVIHVPADFSARVADSQPVSIGLFTDPGRPTQVDIVSQVVGSFVDQVTSTTVAAALVGPAQAGRQIKLPTIAEVQSGAREVGAMAYYAAGMAVMYMLMSAIQRAKSILQDREEGTLSRILISPTPRWLLLCGQTLSTALLITAQFLILLLATTFLYGVEWGDWLPVLAIGLSFAIAASGISTGLAAIFRDPKAADSAVGLLGTVFAALSGSMFPLYLFPEGMLAVARFVPNYWALQGFLDQMAGLGATQALLPVTILCIIGVATGALGAWRLAAR